MTFSATLDEEGVGSTWVLERTEHIDRPHVGVQLFWVCDLVLAENR